MIRHRVIVAEPGSEPRRARHRPRRRVLAARRSRSLVLAAVALVAGSLAPAVTPATAQTPRPQQPTGTGDSTDATGDNCPTGTGQTAAAALGYTNPVFSDDFNSVDQSKWMLFDTDRARHVPGQFEAQPGGRRSPQQVSASNGILTITGTPDGHTGGMDTSRSHQQPYGLWEARVKIPSNAVDYHSVLIVLTGGEDQLEAELDFMEVTDDPSGRQVGGYLHMPGGEQSGRVTLQDNDWHNWAIEWTPQRIRLFRDGQPWLETRDGSQIPSQPGVMSIQFDWFPDDPGQPTGDSQLQVDWVRIYRQSNGSTSNGNGTATSNGCSTACPTGVNSLSQCVQPVGNGNNGTNGTDQPTGCRWYKHPQQDFIQEFSPNAAEGSVLVFYGCYDPQSGLVTAPPAGPEAGGAVGPVPVKVVPGDARACDVSQAPTNVQQASTDNRQQSDGQQQGDQQTDTSQRTNDQPPGDQETDDRQQSDQACDYYVLPQTGRYHPTVAIGLLLTNSQVQLAEAPELLTTPPMGEAAIVNEPTFVCVTNFPSGTNFPGAASVPENRRRRTGGGQDGQTGQPEQDDQDGQDGEQGPTDQQPDGQSGQDGQNGQNGQEGQTPGGTTPSSAPVAAASDQGHDRHTGAGHAIRSYARQQEPDGQQPGDQGNGNGQQDQQNQDQDGQNEQQQDGQQTGNRGNGGFTPGVVGSLTPGQQACLDAQTGRGGSGGSGNGSGQSDGNAQQASDDRQDQQGDTRSTSDDRGSGNDGEGGNGGSDTGDEGGSGGSGNGTGGQGQSSSGLNQPVNGLCAPAAHTPTGQSGQPDQPGQVEGTVAPGTGGDTTSPDQTTDPSQPTDPNQTTDPNSQVQPVTDQTSGNSVGACVRVQLYPTIRWDPGDGTAAFECAAPGTVYDAEGASTAEQTSDTTDCVHVYSKETGIDDPVSGEARPSEWPGKVSVVWRADWDACLVHAPQGSSQYSTGAGHEGNYVNSTGMNFDFASLGEGGQAPGTGQTGEVSSGNAYAGTYNLGLDDDGVQSAVAPLPRAVEPVSGLNTGSDQG